MSHDIHAAWATAQIARDINQDNSSVFEDADLSGVYAYASREGRNRWPIADGVVSIEHQNSNYPTALEFKRQNEGLHGVLTALGQAHAYLQKGYTSSFVVIPERYESHINPGGHLKSVVDYTSPDMPIAVFTYSEPDATLTSPFEGKLRCIRKVSLLSNPFGGRTAESVDTRTETQWAHLREGSSDADAFFKYLQIAKQGLEEDHLNKYAIPSELIAAVSRLAPGQDPYKYLANANGDGYADKVWREFWFKHVLAGSVMQLVSVTGGTYQPVVEPSDITLPNGANKMFFAGRSDSIKNKLAEKLNNNEIQLNAAWDEFAMNVRNRAHSYREDIDSGLEHVGMLESDGRPTELGYRFVDACQRTGDSNSGLPKKILGSAILKNGQLGAFLHYIYRLSESAFAADPLAFTNTVNGRLVFKRNEYLLWLENELANNLNAMRKVSARGGTARQPFQAELAILRSHGFVGSFRVGNGLEIKWPLIQEALEQ